MLRVKKGYAIYYFCFDIGDEVRLDQAERLAGAKLAEEVSEERLKPAYMHYRAPPLYLALKDQAARIGSRKLAIRRDAKLYAFGALTIRYWLPISGTLAAVGRQAAAFERAVPLKKLALAEAKRIAGELAPAIADPVPVPAPAEYVLFAVKSFSPAGPADGLPQKHWKEIGRLLKREDVLSFQELAEAKEGFSYYPDELVVVDWGAALVVDPRGSYDVLDVLEYAVLELLELRTYDEKLEAILDKAYEDVGRRRLLRWRSGRMLNELLWAQADVADIVSKVENALKPIGDQYLAKVYRAASREFGLDQWKHGVQHKLSALKDIYLSLAEHMEAQRAMALELLMLALFLGEIVLLAAWGASELA
ncbi:MAG TPA: hypothetical protein VJB16_00610 [archaeon]|nr:hypothetical protein [archaeon]